MATLSNEIKKNPTYWMKFQIKKMLALFSWYEYPNNYNFYLMKETSKLLKWPKISFIPVLLLTITALFLGKNSFQHKKLYLTLLTAVFLCIFPFYPFSRFRMPIAIMMIIPAGIFFILLSDFIKNKKYSSSILLGAAANKCPSTSEIYLIPNRRRPILHRL